MKNRTVNCGIRLPGSRSHAVEGEGTVVLMAHGFGSEKRGHTPLFMTEGLKAAASGYTALIFRPTGTAPSPATS